MACGTGRFLQFADYGLDVSQEMLQISKNTFPNKHIIKGESTSMPFENSFFNNIISFMHLDIAEFGKIAKETYRVAKKDAYFIFDIPSKKRRDFTSYKATSWYGGNEIKVSTFKKLITNEWNLVTYYGIAFFPIHRIPKSLRKYFIKLDFFLCKSIFKEYSSHLVFVLQKK